MIELTSVVPRDDAIVELTFNDGSRGLWSAKEIIARRTVMTESSSDAVYFARAFVEAGALAWPNGLELAPWTLQANLRDAGLVRTAGIAAA